MPNRCLAIVLLFLSACSAGALEDSPPEARAASANVLDPVQPTEISFDKPLSIPDLATGKVAPPTGEQFSEQLSNSGHKWFYGGGIGRTIANVGTVVVFPPYALYLLGNAGLALAGYSPLYVSDLLPEQPREYVLGAYDGVTSVPGRLNALIAGESFQEQEVSRIVPAAAE